MLSLLASISIITPRVVIIEQHRTLRRSLNDYLGDLYVSGAIIRITMLDTEPSVILGETTLQQPSRCPPASCYSSIVDCFHKYESTLHNGTLGDR